jgi:PmbA protein
MESILEKALEAAIDAEVFRITSTSRQVNFENGRLKKVDNEEEFGMALRLVNKEGQVGFASTTREDDVEGLVKRAEDVAEFGANCRFDMPSEQFSKKAKSLPLFSERTASMSPEAMVEQGLEIVRLLHGYEPQIQVFCGFGVGAMEVAVMNSAGLRCEYAKTGAGVGLGGRLIEGKNLLTCFESRGAIDFDFDLPALARKVIEDFEIARKNVPFKSGEYPVVFTPHAVGDLLLPIIVCCNGRAAAKGISPWKDRLGEDMFDQRITIYDDGLLANGPGSAYFDDEGVPMRKTPIVEDGSLENFITDLDSAFALNLKPTGNGLRSKRMGNVKDAASPPAPAITNLTMDGGDIPLDDMMKKMGDGVLIDRLMGTMMGNLYSGVVSGNILLGYKVEGGRPVGRIKDAMMSVNAFEALKTGLAGLSKERLALGNFLLPHVWLKGVNIATKG